ncbi:hypothetical protein AMTRI_Chr02g259140 [Amborella trichopoda]
MAWEASCPLSMKPFVLLTLLSPLPSSFIFFFALFLSLYATYVVLLCCPTHNLPINSNPKSRIKPR